MRARLLESGAVEGARSRSRRIFGPWTGIADSRGVLRRT
jgi:hypothetical protein